MGILDDIRSSLFGEVIYSHNGGRRIRIVRRYTDIVLLVDDVPFSRIRENSVFVDGYWDFFILLPLLYDNPKSLMIGLGGGTVLYQYYKVFRNPDIEAVDIDKDMITAENRMLDNQIKAKVTLEDGAEFLHNTTNTYDIVILDAYNNYNMTTVFLTEQFLSDAYDKMSENGILAINYIPIEENSNILKLESSKRYNIYMIYMKSSANQILLFSKKLTKRQILVELESKLKRSNSTINSVEIKSYITSAYEHMVGINVNDGRHKTNL